MLAKDIEVYHITWNVQLFKFVTVATDRWLWTSYHTSYATHHKRPMDFGEAYRKGYRLVGNPSGLVVGEDRWDHHSYLSSTVWITWCWKIRQPTYSRDKSLAGLLLINWQKSLRWLEGRKENCEASELLWFLYISLTYQNTAPLKWY